MAAGAATGCRLAAAATTGGPGWAGLGGHGGAVRRGSPRTGHSGGSTRPTNGGALPWRLEFQLASAPGKLPSEKKDPETMSMLLTRRFQHHYCRVYVNKSVVLTSTF